MLDKDDFLETGDFMIEYNSQYLGRGKVSIKLTALKHELRRDEYCPPQKCQIKSVKWCLNAQLYGAARFWQLLDGGSNLSMSQFFERIFTQGAPLRLYPFDERQSGYEFKRVFLEQADQHSGDNLTPGYVSVSFTGEADCSDRQYLVRLAPGSRPENIKMPTAAMSSYDVSHHLGGILSEKLDAVLDQTLCINFFAPHNRGSYALKLLGCSPFDLDLLPRFDYSLTARFPVEGKSRVDQKLFDAACQMHNQILKFPNGQHWICVIGNINFEDVKNVSGQTMTDSVLNLTLMNLH